MIGSSNPTSQLMELRQSKTISSIDYDGICIGKIHPRFNDGSGNKDRSLAVDEVKDDHKQRRAEARSKAKEVALKVFDLHVCLAEEKINKVFNFGFNTTRLDQLLQDMNDLRPALEQAVESEDKAQIKEVQNQIRAIWKKLRKAHLVKEARKFTHRITQLQERTQRTIDRLKENGINTTSLEAGAAAVDALIEEAKAALEAGDKDRSRDLLKQAKDEFKDLADDLKDSLKEERDSQNRNRNRNRTRNGSDVDDEDNNDDEEESEEDESEDEEDDENEE